GLIYKAIVAGLKQLGIDIPKQFASLGGMIVDGLIGGLKAKVGHLKDTVVGMGSRVTGWFADKLGIKSPSRVFADYGRNTIDGYRLGLITREDSALSQIKRFAGQVRAAGAAAALGVAA